MSKRNPTGRGQSTRGNVSKTTGKTRNEGSVTTMKTCLCSSHRYQRRETAACARGGYPSRQQQLQPDAAWRTLQEEGLHCDALLQSTEKTRCCSTTNCVHVLDGSLALSGGGGRSCVLSRRDFPRERTRKKKTCNRQRSRGSVVRRWRAYAARLHTSLISAVYTVSPLLSSAAFSMLQIAPEGGVAASLSIICCVPPPPKKKTRCTTYICSPEIVRLCTSCCESKLELLPLHMPGRW